MLKSSAPAAVVEQDPLEYYDLLTSQIEVTQMPLLLTLFPLTHEKTQTRSSVTFSLMRIKLFVCRSSAMTAAWSRSCFLFIPSVSFWRRSRRSECSTPPSRTSRGQRSHTSLNRRPSCTERWSGRRSWGVRTHTHTHFILTLACLSSCNRVFVLVSGMPVLYWFSRRMSLWGTISFNLAVFINLIIAFFYPYDSGQGTAVSTVTAAADQ